MNEESFDSWHSARWLEHRTEFMLEFGHEPRAADMARYLVWLGKKYADEHPSLSETACAITGEQQ